VCRPWCCTSSAYARIRRAVWWPRATPYPEAARAILQRRRRWRRVRPSSRVAPRRATTTRSARRGRRGRTWPRTPSSAHVSDASGRTAPGRASIRRTTRRCTRNWTAIPSTWARTLRNSCTRPPWSCPRPRATATRSAGRACRPRPGPGCSRGVRRDGPCSARTGPTSRFRRPVFRRHSPTFLPSPNTPKTERRRCRCSSSSFKRCVDTCIKCWTLRI